MHNSELIPSQIVGTECSGLVIRGSVNLMGSVQTETQSLLDLLFGIPNWQFIKYKY